MTRNTANLLVEVICLLMIATLPTLSLAQSVESLRAGTKIRVRSDTTHEWRVGYIQSVDSAGIVANTTSPGDRTTNQTSDTHRWTVPLLSENRVEISRGRGSRVNRTVVGALLGAVGGGLLIGAIGSMATRCSNCEESGIGVLAGPLIGAPIGFLFGGLAGLASARERWEPVPLADSGISIRRR